MTSSDDNGIRALVLGNFEEHGRVMAEAAHTLPVILEELVAAAIASIKKRKHADLMGATFTIAPLLFCDLHPV